MALLVMHPIADQRRETLSETFKINKQAGGSLWSTMVSVLTAGARCRSLAGQIGQTGEVRFSGRLSHFASGGRIVERIGAS